MKNSEFETEEGHLNLDTALDEIRFLYKTYGLEKDINLTDEAKELKRKIRKFILEIHQLPVPCNCSKCTGLPSIEDLFSDDK